MEVVSVGELGGSAGSGRGLFNKRDGCVHTFCFLRLRYTHSYIPIPTGFLDCDIFIAAAFLDSSVSYIPKLSHTAVIALSQPFVNILPRRPPRFNH